MDTQQSGSGEKQVKEKFNFKHEEKLYLNKDVVLHERGLLKSEREIYVGGGKNLPCYSGTLLLAR
jgi:hypothetical protein